MKEIVTTTANFLAVIAGGKLRPEIEVGLVLSEPTYRPDHGGEMIRERKFETVRFSASPHILRRMAEGLIEFADDAEKEIVGMIEGGMK